MNADFMKYLKKNKAKTDSLFQSLSLPYLESLFSFLQKCHSINLGEQDTSHGPGKSSASTAAQPPCIPSPLFFILNLTIKYFPMPESIYCQRAIFCFALIAQINKRGGKEKKK